MTPENYKTERQRRGTLKGVAALLGKHWTTIARRESGEITFDREAWLALCSLPLRKTKSSRKGTNVKGVPTSGADTGENSVVQKS